MVKRHNVILAGSIALTMAAGGYVGWGTYKDRQRQKQHEQSVATMVEQFKACPDRFVAYRGCFSGEDISRLRTEAEASRSEGRFEDAAIKFDMIGMNNEASEMAGRCPENVRRRILEKFSIRRDAVAAAQSLDRQGRFATIPMDSPARIPAQTPAPSAGTPGSAAPGNSAAPETQGPAASSDASSSLAPVSPAPSGSAQEQPGQLVSVYTTRTNPFELNDALRTVVSETSGNDIRAKVDAVFSRLRRGGTSGVSVMDMAGRPPRTAAEALSQGGDCTDLANIVIALFRELRIPGGALVLHFNNAPADVDHMVPYAQIGGRRVIVDLQTGRLGDTAQGEYREVSRLTYDQAAFMYHREQGDYYRDRGQSTEALASYRRAVELFDGDGYTYQNLGVLLERSRDMRGAQAAFQRAAQLDSRYRGDQTRGSFNYELQQGQEAFSRQDWQGCAAHFRNALATGIQLSQTDRQSVERNISACDANAGVRRK